MNPREERKLYVDFARSGGVVESSPTRMLPELVFTGRTKSQLDIELEQHSRMVQETLGESAYEGARLRKTVQVARPIFLDLSLTEPGIVELKDDFYTGWFRTRERGRICSVFRKVEGIPLSQHISSSGKAYFLLDTTQAKFWNRRVKEHPLTVEEMDAIFLSPGLEAHPSYQSLSGLDLRALTNEVGSTADMFWNTLRLFDRSDTSDFKREFLRDSLLDLEILHKVHENSHKSVIAEIRGSMEKSEITVFPLGNEGCVVRYISDLEDRKDKGSRLTTTKTLPLPHNLIRHFQRYGRLGERPMTKIEFENQYRRLVDPNTKLSF